ncbi:MAG: prepilin-type N-terminal cleavage/methylation domain-containing protein [Candidatus Omnitrophica bacterium]|nr:prepilin-type N-terminal cleavage/methylation domain-containing protein [Candidatus Omnitrophota bacterium]
MKIWNKGFSLVEFMAGLAVCAIVILMMVSMGTIALKSYKDLENKSGLNSDTQFPQDAIRAVVRGSQTVPIIAGGGSSLIVDSSRFYLSGTNLMYENTAVSPTKTVRILTGISAPVFTVSGTSLVTVRLQYTKAGTAYDYLIEADRRNNP